MITINNLPAKVVFRKDGHLRFLINGVAGSSVEGRYDAHLDTGRIISGLAGVAIGAITYFKAILPLLQ